MPTSKWTKESYGAGAGGRDGLPGDRAGAAGPLALASWDWAGPRGRFSIGDAGGRFPLASDRPEACDQVTAVFPRGGTALGGRRLGRGPAHTSWRSEALPGSRPQSPTSGRP